MPLIDLPHPPSVRNAPANAAELAVMLRDATHLIFNGRRPAAGGRCKMCGRKPGQKPGLRPARDELFEIVIDPSQDSRVQIGIGRCHSHHLAAAVRRLLALEEQGQHPNQAARMQRLREVLRHLRA